MTDHRQDVARRILADASPGVGQLDAEEHRLRLDALR
jgi:hypothetical protein